MFEFDARYGVLRSINSNIGQTKTISLSCCIHLLGKYDFLAALPKKDGLEIRFSLSGVLDNPRLKQSVPVSAKDYKNCIDVMGVDEIDGKLINWITEAYKLKSILRTRLSRVHNLQ